MSCIWPSPFFQLFVKKINSCIQKRKSLPLLQRIDISPVDRCIVEQENRPQWLLSAMRNQHDVTTFQSSRTCFAFRLPSFVRIPQQLWALGNPDFRHPHLSQIFVSPQAPCELNPCANGGTCHPVEMVYDFKCACPPGFFGKQCEKCKYAYIFQMKQMLLRRWLE